MATTGCSMVSLGYNRLPDLGLWWLQRQIELPSEQSAQARTELEALLAWHRRTQLKPAAQMLQGWQRMATQDISAEQACQEFAQVRGMLDTLAQQAVPGITRLASRLTPEQMPSLIAAQRKSNEAFRQDHLKQPASGNWLGASAAAGTESPGLNKRLNTLVDRYTQLYGALTPQQLELLRQSLLNSAWQPERTLAERQRRQADVLSTLRQMQALPPGANAAGESLVRAWLARLAHSPTPGYAAYSQAVVGETCAQFSAMHQSASAQQRQTAATKLRGYEQDLLGLMVP